MTIRIYSNEDRSVVVECNIPIDKEGPPFIRRQGQRLERDFEIEQGTIQSGTGTFINLKGERKDCWPQFSSAMAVHPEQIQETRKVYADAGIKDVEFNKWGEVKCDSPSHKKRLMEARGQYDRSAYY